MPEPPGTPFDLDRYLARIGVDWSVQADAESLARLQESHLRAIPFETLAISLGHPIRLALDHLVHKMIAQRRGGFCFEQNTLFGAALDALGFDVAPRLARVWWRSEGRVRPRTHHVLLVALEGRRWLADAGFGGPGLRRPIPLATGAVVAQTDGRFRLRADGTFGYVLERACGEDWSPLYSFAEGERAWPADFEMGAHFAATHPDSPFTRRLVIMRLTERGRVSLLDRSLVREEGGERIEQQALDSERTFRKTLEQDFDLTLTAAESRRAFAWTDPRRSA